MAKAGIPTGGEVFLRLMRARRESVVLEDADVGWIAAERADLQDRGEGMKGQGLVGVQEDAARRAAAARGMGALCRRISRWWGVGDRG